MHLRWDALVNSPGGKVQAQVEMGTFTGKKKAGKKGDTDTEDCEVAQRVGTKRQRRRQQQKKKEQQGCTSTAC